MSEETTFHELVGGDAWFDELVDRFYDGVAADPVLRPMYPDDLAESRRLLAGFLVQYFGGPPRYSEERGHPRLRMRHVPFRIGPTERDAWLRHMLAALDEVQAPPEARAAFVGYVTRAAEFLRNAD